MLVRFAFWHLVNPVVAIALPATCKDDFNWMKMNERKMLTNSLVNNKELIENFANK